jgi:hypothetical protein
MRRINFSLVSKFVLVVAAITCTVFYSNSPVLAQASGDDKASLLASARQSCLEQDNNFRDLDNRLAEIQREYDRPSGYDLTGFYNDPRTIAAIAIYSGKNFGTVQLLYTIEDSNDPKILKGTIRSIYNLCPKTSSSFTWIERINGPMSTVLLSSNFSTSTGTCTLETPRVSTRAVSNINVVGGMSQSGPLTVESGDTPFKIVYTGSSGSAADCFTIFGQFTWCNGGKTLYDKSYLPTIGVIGVRERTRNDPCTINPPDGGVRYEIPLPRGAILCPRTDPRLKPGYSGALVPRGQSIDSFCFGGPCPNGVPRDSAGNCPATPPPTGDDCLDGVCVNQIKDTCEDGDIKIGIKPDVAGLAVEPLPPDGQIDPSGGVGPDATPRLTNSRITTESTDSLDGGKTVRTRVSANSNVIAVTLNTASLVDADKHFFTPVTGEYDVTNRTGVTFTRSEEIITGTTSPYSQCYIPTVPDSYRAESVPSCSLLGPEYVPFPGTVESPGGTTSRTQNYYTYVDRTLAKTFTTQSFEFKGGRELGRCLARYYGFEASVGNLTLDDPEDPSQVSFTYNYAYSLSSDGDSHKIASQPLVANARLSAQIYNSSNGVVYSTQIPITRLTNPNEPAGYNSGTLSGTIAFPVTVGPYKAGDKFCGRLIITNGTGGASILQEMNMDGTPLSPTGDTPVDTVGTCPGIYDKPYVKVVDSEIKLCSATGSIQANARTRPLRTNSGAPGYRGSSSNYPITSPAASQGVFTQAGGLAAIMNSATDARALYFANTTGAAWGGDFGPTVITTTPGCRPDLSLAANQTMYNPARVLSVVGDIVINDDNTLSANGANISGYNSSYDLLSATGNITVAANVNNINPKLYAGGYVSTCNAPTSANIFTECSRKLVVKGGISAKKVYLLRTNGSIRGALPNEQATSANIAEVVGDYEQPQSGPIEDSLGDVDSIVALPVIL